VHLIENGSPLKPMDTIHASRMRVLIADDEAIARERLKTLLTHEHDCEIVSECKEGSEALDALRRYSPELAFLEVEMLNLDGFAVLEAIGRSAPTAVVFVTADEQHAVRAFDEGAVDFLLKPFSEERFYKAIDRVRASLGKVFDDAGVSNANPVNASYSAPLVVHSKGKYLFLRTRDVDYVRAGGNYVHIFCGAERHTVCSSMAAVEARLDPNLFVRIHRSAIVNIARIREAVPWFNGEHALVLQDGTELNIGRSYRERFEQMMAA